MTKTLFYNLFL